MTFGDFVAGKSIAVVGPAPMVGDQSADIEGHDLVYRTFPIPSSSGRGTRTDMVFLNGGEGRRILNDDRTQVRAPIEDAEWWVYKRKGNHRPAGRYRFARRTPIVNPNQVTMMLWDLIPYDVTITVFGADLYASGPNNAYASGYRTWDAEDRTLGAGGVIIHRPFEQMSIHREVLATGKVKGDDRYLAAVNMTDDEYRAVIASWKAVLEEAP